MIGVISSYNTQRRSGYIKEKEKNALYYFGKSSVNDDSLQLTVGSLVSFDVHRMNGKEPVAVHISSHKIPMQRKSDHVNSVVIWFKEEKKYGYVHCDTKPPIDAFLHQSQLLKAGTRSVRSGEHLLVRLVEDKYPGRPAAIDVILPQKSLGLHSKFNGMERKCLETQPHLNPRNSHHHYSKPNHGSPIGCDQKNIRFSNPLQSVKPRFCSSELAAIPSSSGSSLFRPLATARFDKNCKRNMRRNHSQSQKQKSFVDVPKQTKKSDQPTTSVSTNCLDSKQQLTAAIHPEKLMIQQQIQQKQKLLRSSNITKLPDGGKRLHDQIKELELKLEQLNVSDSEKEEYCPYDKIKPSKSVTDVYVKSVNTSRYDYSLYSMPNEEDLTYENAHYYGGRMTMNRIDKVAKVTSDAIEALHTSLSTCPSSLTELQDPDGLLVELMTHQRQALTWLIWREQQSVSGGILADDMGLGKTLTMISLILKQKQKFADAEETTDEDLKDLSHDEPTTKNKDTSQNDDTGIDDSPTTTLSKSEIETTNDPENNSTPLIPCDSTLVVAPASLIYHWEKEFRNRCQKGLLSIHLYHGNSREKDAEKLSEFDIVITTYGIVRQCRQANESKRSSSETKASEDTLFLINWKRIILDEAHQIRNYKSATSQAACSLHAQSRWALSGTPVQNQESDMYAMIKFLHCRPFDELKLWNRQVCNKTQRGQQRLKTLVSCLVLRREKNQKRPDGKPLISLPARHCTSHTLKLNPVEQEVYGKLKSESQAAYAKYLQKKTNKDKQANKTNNEKLSVTTLLVMLLRLRQCCGHLSLLKNSFDVELMEKEKQQVAVEDLFQAMTLDANKAPGDTFALENYADENTDKYFNISEESTKIKLVMEELHKLNFEQPNDKCVVISQWTSMLHVLAHHLDQHLATMPYAIIEGSVSAKKRMDLVDDFNRNPVKPKIMLVSLQAGGVGLNLVGGNHLFLIDMHWNPALEKQAFDRIYRVGQKKEVFIHRFVVEGTVEEQILKLQERKLAIAQAVMEGADMEQKVKLTLADMKSLFDI